MTLDVHLSGIWHFQRIALACLCRLVTMGRVPFKRGDTWHCDEHKRADIEIIAVSPATLAEREELTR
jgi:hypothetical protein